MKKLSGPRKLALHSETVRALTSNQLVLVGGGLRTAIPTHADACTFYGGGICPESDECTSDPVYCA